MNRFTEGMRRLTFPAPRRASVECSGGWYSRAWTEDDVREALSGGAWFLTGCHDFSNPAAARLARVKVPL